MPNMFDNISVEKAPLTSGANSVNMANTDEYPSDNSLSPKLLSSYSIL